MTKLEIGTILKAKREALGYSPTKVARELTIRHGATVQHRQIKAMEEASNAYTIDLLLKLCDFYGVSMQLV